MSATVSPEVIERIEGHSKLIDFFGLWPSFHDSEIVSMSFNRDEGEDLMDPLLTTVTHLFNLGLAQDHPDQRHSLMTFQFHDVQSLLLRDFTHQNAINDLVISTRYSLELKQERFDVDFIAGFGMGCRFDCARIEVSSVIPFKPRFGAYARGARS